MRLLILFIAFAFFGVGGEVMFTSIRRFIQERNARLEGKSYLWMFLIYGSALFLVMFVRWLYADYHILFRALVYMVLIFCCEYGFGWLISKIIGRSPWDYSKRKYNIKGLINLAYAPVWFIVGLLFETYYIFLTTYLF